MAKRALPAFCLLALLFGALPANAFPGSGCGETRLDLDATVLGDVDPHDQGESNLCFAYSARQLIEAANARTRQAPGTSSVLLAFQTIRDESLPFMRSGFYGGWVEGSLEVARREGVCLSRGETVADLFGDELGGVLKPERQKEILSLLDPMCERKIEIPLPVTWTLTRRESGGEGLRAALLRNLRESVPVAVNFCSEVATFRSHSPAPGGLNLCSRHYAVAVGSRMREGRCEILMRDSLCESYRRKKGFECERGQYWIRSDQLIENTDRLNWLAPADHP